MSNKIIDSYSKTYNIPKNEVEKVWKQVYNKFSFPKPYGLIHEIFKYKIMKIVRNRKAFLKNKGSKNDSTESR
jgi:hypothetical protein